MKVEVVTSGVAGCPSCESAKKLVRKVLQDFPDIDFWEIDSLEEPDRLQAFGFVTSGAVVINDILAFSSLPKETVLREKIQQMFSSNKKE